MSTQVMHRLTILTLLILLAALAACGTQPETVTVVETVEVETEVRVVETVEVVTTVEVEKEVVVTATAEAEAATAEESSAPSGTSGPKQLTINEVFWPDNGMAIETDDAFAFSRWGITEGLVKIDHEGQLVPGLAESWEQRDETNWVFTLRSDVTFHNGESFNAEAVVTALNYLLEGETPPRGLEPENIVSMEVEDEKTLVITTVAADALFPNRLSGPSLGILAPEAYSSTPPDVMGTGTGPFILTDIVPSQSATLIKNENYWGGPVNLDEVLVLSTPEGEMRATMLRTGEIELVSQLPVPQMPLLEADSELTIVRNAQPRTVTMYLNNDNGPLSDVLIRRAVLHAIDKETLVAAVLEGIGQPAAGPFAPSEVWANTELSADTFDPDQSRALLDEAGVAEGELTLRLWTYASRPDQPPMAVAIQQMLADVGIMADIRVAPYNTLEPDVREGNFDMFIVSRGHLLDSYDPEGFLTADLGCDGSFNLSLYCNPTVDEMLAEARTITDPEGRYELYQEIQTIVVEEDVVDIWLNYTEQLYGYRNNVLNFQPHPLDYYTLTPELDVTN